MFKGTWTDGENSCDLVMACYVDDFLIVSSHPKAAEFVQSMLRTRVEKVKITGHISANQPGRLMFLGREIERFDTSCSLFVRIPVSYLHELVKDLKPTATPPNIDLESEKDSPALDDERRAFFDQSLDVWHGIVKHGVTSSVFSIVGAGTSSPTTVPRESSQESLEIRERLFTFVAKV